MYLKRKIDEYLHHWKESPDRKPLIIKGARQVGKTESIQVFAQECYKNVIYINFILDPQYMTILSEGYSVDAIIKNISIINPRYQFISNETLIIFDELQQFPDIATSLKSFCLDGRYDVICSGSLLGIHYKQIHSNSVGYKTDYEMYSMDFEEFLWAMGYPSLTRTILEKMVSFSPFSATEMTVLQRLFTEYCILGGMPAVVRVYVEKKTFSGSLEIQHQIQLDYEEDVRKYAIGLEQKKITNVYRSIPAQLGKENKKFQFNKIAPSARSREYSGCIDWLLDAGIINACYCLHFPELPLKGNIDTTKFKLYIADTGLLVSSLDEEAQENLRANRNLGVYKGALYENFTAEAFVKQGLGLYYYKRDDSTLEEDFFVRTAEDIIPVEVKANHNVSQSLRTLVDSDKYPEIQRGIKFAKQNIGKSNDIMTFPYFCVFLLKRFLQEAQMQKT